MEIKAQLNNLRIAPRKSREVADLIRGKDVIQAKALLEFMVKRATGPVLKLLNSATASAFHNHRLKDSDLYISKITVDEGPKLKRWHPMSRGRAYEIMKRTSHITLVLSEKKQGIKATRKEKKKTERKESVKTKKNNSKFKMINSKTI